MRTPASPTLRAVVFEIERRLRSSFGARLRLVSLFGSYARGEATESSDTDVAVVIDGMTEDDRARALDIVRDVELDQDVAVSALVISRDRLDALTDARAPLALDILGQGHAS